MAAVSGPRARLGAAVDRVRSSAPILDRLVRTVRHYSAVDGRVQAGGVTYFAFLSFFPVLALAFFVVGYVARVWPQARDNLVAGIEQVLPGLVGDSAGQISLSAIQDNAGAAGLIGVAGLLYAGLGWIAALRSALVTVFELPADRRPGFLTGKLRDLLALVLIGVVLLVSVSVSSLVGGFSEQVMGWLGVDRGASWVLWVVSVAVGLAASAVLFFTLFTLLSRPRAPRRALWSGALVGATAFELLKWASTYLLQATRHQPAAQAFGIALILLVWINYFSQVVLYAASWAHTSGRPEPVVEPGSGRAPASDGEAAHAVVPATRAPVPPVADATAARGPFVAGAAAGAAAMLALVKLLRRR